jgi:hypothetical protein
MEAAARKQETVADLGQEVALSPRTPNRPAPISESAAFLGMIERLATTPNVNIDVFERLLAMQRTVKADRAKEAYVAALAAMQPELPVITERGRIEVREKGAGGERNGKLLQSTGYAKWEDINEAIKPVLAEHGFALSFRTGTAPDGKITVTGILSHAEGHQEETTLALPHDSTGSKNAVQAVGSSTSYGKRYTASALLNITSRGEDDDGKKGGDEDPITPEQAHHILDRLNACAANIEKFCQYLKIPSVDEIPASRYSEAIKAVEVKEKQSRTAQ